MQSYVTTTTPITTGLKTINCGFQPKFARIEVVKPAYNVNQSVGEVDSSNYVYSYYNFDDNVIQDTDDTAGFGAIIVDWHTNVSNVSTSVNTADMSTAAGAGMFATTFKYNVTNVTNALQYKITILG